MYKNNLNQDDFFKYLYLDNKYRVSRKKSFIKDVEKFKSEISQLTIEEKLIRDFCSYKFPVVFIVGNPRSGTTLLSQLIVNHFRIGFISNEVASNFLTPLRSLVALEKGIREKVKLISDLGKTTGKKSPHEFGYFWQSYFLHKQHDELTKKEINKIDWKRLNSHISAMTSYINQPILFKNPVFINFKIEELYNKIDNCFFINIERLDEFNIQSIYEARISFYNNENKWWSIKPSIWTEWTNLHPIDQIFNQVNYVKKSIHSQLNKIPSENYINISYEKLVNSPKSELIKISKLLSLKESLPEGKLNGNTRRMKEEFFNRVLYKK